jgi:hypoxanthine phosphoribosyltransferase
LSSQKRTPLFDEALVGEHVARVAQRIVAAPQSVDMAVGVLTGAFVFAADLLRALARCGLDLPIEFVWLSRYGAAREGVDEIAVKLGPSAAMRGRHVLLIDGVLDHGHTLAKARAILLDAGAASVTVVVAVDKARDGALLKADYAAFSGVDAFIVGYGMDDAGMGRGLPFIAGTE